MMMMNKKHPVLLLLLVVMLFIAQLVSAAPKFTATYGDGNTNVIFDDVLYTRAGGSPGFLYGGFTIPVSADTNAAYLTDATGAVVWGKYWGDPSMSCGTHAIAQSRSNDQLVAVGFAVRTNPWAEFGQVSVLNPVNGAVAQNYYIVPIPDNVPTKRLTAVIPIGSNGGYLVANQDTWVARLDATGLSITPATKYLYPSIQFAPQFWELQATSDGGFIVLGQHPENGKVYLVLTKLNAALQPVWAKRYLWTTNGISLPKWGLSVTPDGGFFVAGSTNLYQGPTPSDFDVLVMKTDSAGNVQWARVIGGLDNDYGQTSVVDDGYIVGGVYYDANQEGLLMKITLTGTIAWIYRYISGSGGHDLFNQVRRSGLGGYVIGGDYRPGVHYGWGLHVDELGNSCIRKIVPDLVNNQFVSIVAQQIQVSSQPLTIRRLNLQPVVVNDLKHNVECYAANKRTTQIPDQQEITEPSQ